MLHWGAKLRKNGKWQLGTEIVLYLWKVGSLGVGKNFVSAVGS